MWCKEEALKLYKYENMLIWQKAARRMWHGQTHYIIENNRMLAKGSGKILEKGIRVQSEAKIDWVSPWPFRISNLHYPRSLLAAFRKLHTVKYSVDYSTILSIFLRKFWNQRQVTKQKYTSIWHFEQRLHLFTCIWVKFYISIFWLTSSF